MGLEYKMVVSEQKVLDSVICDRCNTKIESDHDYHWNQCGEPYDNFQQPMFDKEYFVLKTSWGYFSDQKDGEIHTAVLCEPCYDEVFKDVKIKITNYM